MPEEKTTHWLERSRLLKILTPIVIFLLLCFFSVAMNLQERAGESSVLYTLSFLLTPLTILLGLFTIIIRLAFKSKPAYIWIAEGIIILFVLLLLFSIT